MITIDRERALELLEQCVAERGEQYRYSDDFNPFQCEYVVNDRPACMVGDALYRAGVDVRTLNYLSGGISEDLIALRDLCGVEASVEAVAAFRTAQNVQDNGGTWGLALDAARHERDIEGAE